MSLRELQENWYYRYHPSALYHLSKKYNLLPENAQIILDILYNIDENSAHTPKIKELAEMKKYLKEKNLLITNDLFRTYIKTVDVMIEEPIRTSLDKKMINEISKATKVTVIDPYQNQNNNKKTVYAFEQMEEEIVFVAEQITKLISQGTDINKIKLYPLEQDYDSMIHKIFGFFQIPYDLNRKTPLIKLELIQTFLELIKTNNLSDSLNIIKEKYNLLNSLNHKIYNKLISIVNKYLEISDYEPYLIYEFKTNTISLHHWNNVITTAPNLPEKDHYYFLLGLNQDCLPKTIKDDDYLSDEEKKILEIETSKEENNRRKKEVINWINSCENITITYKLKSPLKEYIPSTIIEENEWETTKVEYQFTCQKYNDFLVSKKNDELLKYNVYDELIDELYNPNLPYRTYQNQYTKVSFSKLNEYLENYLNLSFSSMDLFFRCQFRFYLNHILKIKDEFEETSSVIIGKLFHQILCDYYQKKGSLEEIIEKTIEEYYKEKQLSAKEQFYNQKYKKELEHLVKILDEQLSRSDFENTYFEKEFSYYINDTIKIKIMGVMDKIMTFEDDNNTYIIVIDYKTGMTHNDFNKVIYGLDMQLLMYDYLIQKTNTFKNPVIAGLYLQPIIKEICPAEDGKTYDDIRFSNTKLDGYTKKEVGLLSHIDQNYQSNTYIKSIRVKSDNTFYNYSKVITEEQLEALRKIVDDNINKVITAVKSCDFTINPKRFSKEKINEITGCAYCSYYDICYKNPKDIKNLKEYKDLSFIRSDEHDTD